MVCVSCSRLRAELTNTERILNGTGELYEKTIQELKQVKAELETTKTDKEFIELRFKKCETSLKSERARRDEFRKRIEKIWKEPRIAKTEKKSV